MKIYLEEVPLHQDFYAFCCNKKTGSQGLYYLLADKDKEYTVRPNLKIDSTDNYEDSLSINEFWKHSGYLPKELLW